MSIYNSKSTENRQKTPELHAEDREAITERWPVRHSAYTEVYVTLQKTFPEAFRQPVQVYDHRSANVNSQPSTNIGEYAVKNYDSPSAELAHFPQNQSVENVNNPELASQAYELLRAAQEESSNA